MPDDRAILWPYEGGEVRDFYYARYAHPTVAEAEARLGELDGGKAILFPSGTGAATALVLTLLKPGDTIALAAGAYFGTGQALRDARAAGACSTSSSTRPGRRPTASSSSGSRRRRTRS